MVTRGGRGNELHPGPFFLWEYILGNEAVHVPSGIQGIELEKLCK